MKNPIPRAFACFAIVGVVLFTSCSKSISSDMVAGDIISGAWTFEQVDYHYFYDGRFYDTVNHYNDKQFIQFKSDSSVYTNTDSLYTGKWNHHRDKLILVANGDSSVFDIKQLTASELVLFIKDTDIDGYSESTWHLKR